MTLNNRSITIVVLLLILSGLPAKAAVRNTDFNGDGKADLFLGNLFSGQLTAWLINGSTVLSRPSYGTVPPGTGWSAFGIKDANADGPLLV